ncbi:hypothetical protein LQ772_13455 [Frateuria edaphi]|uniref:hypothetical protein n=1 Tax=Frateuria edaphi TaxID=2898793 RepID=UPI001E31B694|nr:hypothetical protein [Frateuria edaphi]UGB44987.1 hypothetical protein LQ772_13455 [Frateuria edaphi]
MIDPGVLRANGWFTVGVIVIALILLVTKRLAPLWILGGAVALLVIGGVLSPATAIAGLATGPY